MEKNTTEADDYFIASKEFVEWVRVIAFNKLTMAEVNPVIDELWNMPTLKQFLDLKQPKIIQQP